MVEGALARIACNLSSREKKEPYSLFADTDFQAQPEIFAITTLFWRKGFSKDNFNTTVLTAPEVIFQLTLGTPYCAQPSVSP